MNIDQQDGLVSTIVLTPFNDSDFDRHLRNQLFEAAITISDCPPLCRTDNFDESIVVFDNCYQALSFVTQVFRKAVDMRKNSNIDISIHSSLCSGQYFVHQDQIYGDAVNLATKLSLSSRENEMLVCNLDQDVIKLFLSENPDLVIYNRGEDGDRASIGISDGDATHTRTIEKALLVDYGNQNLKFDIERCRKIEVGRSSESCIRIDHDHISRCHATIKLLYDEVHIEDHSSNGTYVYFDGREVFLSNDSMKVGSSGSISSGTKRDSSVGAQSLITYKMVEKSDTLSAA